MRSGMRATALCRSLLMGVFYEFTFALVLIDMCRNRLLRNLPIEFVLVQRKSNVPDSAPTFDTLAF